MLEVGLLVFFVLDGAMMTRTCAGGREGVAGFLSYHTVDGRYLLRWRISLSLSLSPPFTL